MKISTRIAMVFSMAGILLFGGYAFYLVYKEERELRGAVEREVGMLGRSLQGSIEHALRDQQVEDVRAVLVRLSATDPTLGVLVYGPDGRLMAGTPGVEPGVIHHRAVTAALAQGRVRLAYESSGETGYLVFAAPLQSAPGADIGAVVVARPLHDMREDLRSTRDGIALSVSLFVLVAIALGVLLGRVYIGRPLARLSAAMRNLRTGGLPLDLPADTRDELGELAREFNELVHQLRDARARLETELESRRRLEHAVQHADKLITIGQLSAGLAHEIGSPLQVLNGRAHALLTRADDPQATRKNAEIIVRETDRIAGIVEQLLRFSRRRAARFEPVDLEAVAGTVLELLELEARRRGVSLRMRVEGPLPAVHGDGDQLQQVLINLVSNALQATAAGGEVEVRLEAVPGFVHLGVIDSGHGIPEELQGHLFEPFFTTRGVDGGTGLGLAVVSSIVDDLGGTVSVQSAPGAGSTFMVALPCRPGPGGAIARGDAIIG